eukprot:CAMPEP_0177255166 /NCGR_PEP_ID=MMETSP0367-20130122/56193_1 /TAXON_ID=447022 ORGANISM="Scrippsiella hangoei-like, Strain SHHI-4" /NCGR_SAMPLE_ID=MMETSP0367 /ASSEMBLY_ACC=CAM_ASM_000362 /LENGTH=31 /DNA_ID= /DNA_START= /DNA_END= /DNA_ORIENTATION=
MSSPTSPPKVCEHSSPGTTEDIFSWLAQAEG